MRPLDRLVEFIEENKDIKAALQEQRLIILERIHPDQDERDNDFNDGMAEYIRTFLLCENMFEI